MENKETYHVVQYGKKTSRRDYSKVSSGLPLPDLTEIQTNSFEWFLKEGIREVFDDIYPISNFAGNIRLKFLDYEFGEPKYSISECKYREVNYCAPLKAKMELEVMDPETGEVMTKWEEVFLGDFPLMTPTGTFIINGAERVIVSQIVRSPGAYFDVLHEDRTNRDTYTCELIPSRGTWLEFMSDDKKAALGRILNVSIDRRRKVLSTILFKAIGMSLNPEKGEDTFDTTAMQKFLKAMHFDVHEDVVVPEETRELQNDYMLLYTSVFGNYEEVKNTLAADKTNTRNEALLAVYENQRTIRAVKALKENDIAEFGRLMNQSHISLRDDYEVSCEEIDILVDLAWKLPGVIGSRITGGGFGGCTVSIVKNDAVDTFIDSIGKTYKEKVGHEAEFYTVDIGAGASRLD